MNKKRITAISMAALLGISAGTTGVYAADSYKAAEKEALAKAIAKMAQTYTSELEASQKLLSGMTENMTLTVDDTGKALLGMFVPADISWFNNIGLDMDVSMVSGQEAVIMGVNVNDQKVLTMETYVDIENMNTYVKIPEFSDAYIKTDMYASLEASEEALEANGEMAGLPIDAFSPEFYKEYMQFVTDISTNLPDLDTMSTLTDRYGNLLIDHMEDVTTGTDTVTVTDVSQECTTFEGALTKEAALPLADELLTTMKSDEELKTMLTSASGKDDLYTKFQNGINDLLEKIGDASVDEGEPADITGITSKLWVDENGDTAGREFNLLGADGASVGALRYLSPKSGDKHGYFLEFNSEDVSVLLSGSGVVADSRLNGNYELSINNTPSLAIEVKDYDTAAMETSGQINGQYIITPLPGLTGGDEAAFGMMNGFALTTTIASGQTEGSISVNISSQGASLGTLTITAEPSDGVTVPDFANAGTVYDTANEEDMNAYAASLNYETIFTNLMAAGMPETFINDILSAVMAPADDGYETGEYDYGDELTLDEYNEMVGEDAAE